MGNLEALVLAAVPPGEEPEPQSSDRDAWRWMETGVREPTAGQLDGLAVYLQPESSACPGSEPDGVGCAARSRI